MNLLSPWTALIAAAVTLPLLVLLYFLKLRRRQLRISSTLLWERTFLELQVNAPFRRLRWSLLLLLQLLLLLALLGALAEPVLIGRGPAESSEMILLIDRSASMNARMAGSGTAASVARTRLDEAKSAAKAIIDNRARSSRASKTMVMAFASSAQVVCGFDSNRQTLVEAVESIQPTDEEANLDAALHLADAFTTQHVEQSLESQPQVVMFSDGGVAPPRESTSFRRRSGGFSYQPVGSSPGAEWKAPAPGAVDNIGIAALSARRDLDDPAKVQIFARLINSGTQPVDVVINVGVDDQPATLMRKTIPAATETSVGEESLQSNLELSGGAVLSVHHNHADALPADDTAWLVLPPPTKPRIAIVHPDDNDADPYLANLVQELEPQRIDVISRSSFEGRDAQQVDAGSVWDLVVFDRVSAQRLPGIPTVTFGATPGGARPTTAPAQSRPAESGRRILSWDRQHPVLRHVSLDTVVYTGFSALDLPPAATPLAFGPDGPVIALLKSRNAGHVVVGFSLARSNWPLNVSVAVFMQNVVEYLTGNHGEAGMVIHPGETVTVRALPTVTNITINGPIGATVPTQPGSTVTLPALRRAGVYSLTGAAPPMDRVAVSMLSDVESDIRVRPELEVIAENKTSRTGGAAGGQELWPWLAAAALALLVLEWLVYCRQVRG